MATQHPLTAAKYVAPALGLKCSVDTIRERLHKAGIHSWKLGKKQGLDELFVFLRYLTNVRCYFGSCKALLPEMISGRLVEESVVKINNIHFLLTWTKYTCN